MQMDFGGLIPIAAGIYVLLGAFRLVRLSNNPETNEMWLQKFGTVMKVLCPIIILLGVAELLGLFA
jgi:hypothetical protein